MSKININLLPWRERRRKINNVFFGAKSIAVIVLALFLSNIVNSWLKLKTSSYQDKVKYLTQEKNKLSPKINKIKALSKEKELWFKRMKIIRKLQTDRNNIVEVFNNLAKVVPDGLFFTYLKWEGVNMRINGVADSNRSIAKLMTNLENLGWNANVTLSEIARARKLKDKISSSEEVRFVIDVKNVINTG